MQNLRIKKYQRTEALKKTISGRISQLIDKSGLSRPQHVERSGLDKSSLSNWLNATTAPDASALCALADYFNVSTDYLLGRHSGKSQSLETIRQYLGLTEPAVDSLRAFNKNDRILGASDMRAGKCQALCEALASREFLELVSSLLMLKSGVAGHFDGMMPDAAGEFYEGKLSPDTYAAALAYRLVLTIERLRKGESGELPNYAPWVRDVEETTQHMIETGQTDRIV